MGGGHKLYSNPTHVLTPFQDVLKWPKWNFHLVANSQVAILSFLSNFPSSNTCFHLFCLSMDISSNCHPQQRSHCFWTWKTTQKLMFFPLFTLQNHFQHLHSFHIISSQFKEKFDVWTQFFQVCHFVGLSKLQREQHTLVLNKTVTHATTLFQVGNELGRFYCTFIWQYTVAVSLCISLKTVIAPHILLFPFTIAWQIKQSSYHWSVDLSYQNQLWRLRQ